jgi:hypothetical protein
VRDDASNLLDAPGGDGLVGVQARGRLEVGDGAPQVAIRSVDKRR